MEMESQEALAGPTTPHRRLISVDLRPGLRNTEAGRDHRIRVHLAPDIHGTDHRAVAPYQIIGPADVQPTDVVIGLTADLHWWSTVPVELAASEMYQAAQNGGLAAALQGDHALLVAEAEWFMSTQKVTQACVATKIDCFKGDIKAWLNSRQTPNVQKEYDQRLWQMLSEFDAYVAKKKEVAQPVDERVFARGHMSDGDSASGSRTSQ
jgi:hypothetical protein